MVGGGVCLYLLYRQRVRGSLIAFTITALAFTLSAHAYTAWRASGLQDGPRLAELVRTNTASDTNDANRVATCDYLPPTLVYYLGHPVERLNDPSQIAAFFQSGGRALVLSESTYEKYRTSLPTNVAIIGEQQRFLKQQKVVLLGQVRQSASNESLRRIR